MFEETSERIAKLVSEEMDADVAQAVEQHIRNVDVVSSSLTIGSKVSLKCL